ncbi:MAG: hypothetical protein P8M30_01855 [Planctomycetaceae bacterium]|nr:hypothetical protein [Planctomycetaceae bacterium]MDG2388040.1 hypothetical protein [Planctomycetaceae bacterium]
MKMWTTRKLKKDHPKRNQWWTKMGDYRQLFTEEAVENAVRYTLEGQ